MSAGTAVSSVTDYSNLEAAFSIDVNGSILDDSKFTLTSAAEHNTLTLTIDNVGDYVVNGDTVKVIYNAPETTHKLVDSDGNVTLDFNQTIDSTNTLVLADVGVEFLLLRQRRQTAAVQRLICPVLGELDECWNSRFRCD